MVVVVVVLRVGERGACNANGVLRGEFVVRKREFGEREELDTPKKLYFRLSGLEPPGEEVAEAGESPSALSLS